jgi:RimJ/RimL family protein N-acetyltransferase
MQRPLKIETSRLILKDWQLSDSLPALEYTSDPLVVRFMPWGPSDLKQTREFIRKSRRQSRQKPRLVFELAVVLKSENKVIGGCGLRIKNLALRESDLGYVLHRRFWGLGYTTEATRALIRFGFSRLKLHRIWSLCDVKNKASARVLEKSGMKFEGIMSQSYFQNQSWHDMRLYAILDKDLKNKKVFNGK